MFLDDSQKEKVQVLRQLALDIGNTGMHAGLLPLLFVHPDYEVKRRACSAAAKLKNPRIVKHIIPCLTDPNSQIRHYAYKAVLSSKCYEIIDHVKKAVRREREAYTFPVLQQILKEAKDYSPLDDDFSPDAWIDTLYNDNADYDAIADAARKLGEYKVKTKQAIEALLWALDTYSAYSGKIRCEIIKALILIDEDSYSDTLLSYQEIRGLEYHDSLSVWLLPMYGKNILCNICTSEYVNIIVDDTRLFTRIATEFGLPKMLKALIRFLFNYEQVPVSVYELTSCLKPELLFDEIYCYFNSVDCTINFVGDLVEEDVDDSDEEGDVNIIRDDNNGYGNGYTVDNIKDDWTPSLDEYSNYNDEWLEDEQRTKDKKEDTRLHRYMSKDD